MPLLLGLVLAGSSWGVVVVITPVAETAKLVALAAVLP